MLESTLYFAGKHLVISVKNVKYYNVV